MANFKFVVSDKERSVQIEKDQGECPILGKKIGENINGEFLGLEGYELLITGGHDKNGFPMRKDIGGQSRRRVLLTKGIGFSARLKRKKKITDVRKGLRKRKTVVGNTISLETAQVSCKVTKIGSKSLNEMFPPKEKKEAEQAS